MTRPIEDIIKRLRDLNIEQEQLLRELSRAHGIETPATLPQSRQAAAKARPRSTAPSTLNFETGDRVRIRNPKSRSVASALHRLEESGTVTRTTPSRVHILTDYNTTVQRGPSNVELESDPEP
jgi:hypothetical protein